MTGKKLYLTEGILKVKARGYWFTSGGEKGSFGYYPHLKDEGDYPVFPDTQIHGDLRMAVKLLCDLEPDGYSRDIIKTIFGSEPKDDYRNAASCLFITDLELSNKSKGKDTPPLRGGDEGEGDKCGLTSGVISKWSSNRFEIKPRIEIDDDNRIIKEHMLVNLEMSYLEGLELEAKVFLGYFEDAETMQKAKELLVDAVQLLSGFGAFRSRGCGRGNVGISWNAEHVFEYNGNTPPSSAHNFTYSLTALTNFRNKQIDPGSSTQLLVSRPYITAEQLRGWFANTYNKIFGAWPDMEDISSMTFPALYPSLLKEGCISPGYPPAATTIKNEKEKVKDMAGRTKIEKDDKEGEEAFFAVKTKPLQSGNFVTDGIEPRVIPVSLEKRARNSIDEKFSTLKEGGLFVQELIGKGTCFAGIIKTGDTQSGFSKRAGFILKNIKPLINGCVFEAKVYAAPEQAVSGRFRLVAEPIPYSQRFFNYEDCKYAAQDGTGGKTVIVRENANTISLTTVRAYNTTLKRPRRPRIVIAPGSVICDSGIKEDRLLAWQGFGKDFKDAGKGKKNATEQKEKKPDFGKIDYFPDLLKDMTRSQAGIVREFLNTTRDMKEIQGVLEDRIAKYGKKEKKGLKGLFEEIKSHLEKDKTGQEMRNFVNFILDELHKAWWNNKK